MNTLRNLFALLAVFVLLGASSAAFAADATLVREPNTISGRGVLQETDNSLYKIGTVVFWVSDDAATVNIDTGTELCNNIGMDCIETWSVTTGTDADLAVITCGTDIADGGKHLSFCN